MRMYVVTESEGSASLVSKLLLVTQAREASVVSGGHGALSLARSLLARRRVPVCLIVDSTASALGELDERRSLESALGQVETSARSRVVVADPVIEDLVLDNPDGLSTLLGEPPPTDWEARRAQDPTTLLSDLFGVQSREALLETLAARMTETVAVKYIETALVRAVLNFWDHFEARNAFLSGASPDLDKVFDAVVSFIQEHELHFMGIVETAGKGGKGLGPSSPQTDSVRLAIRPGVDAKDAHDILAMAMTRLGVSDIEISVE